MPMQVYKESRRNLQTRKEVNPKEKFVFLYIVALLTDPKRELNAKLWDFPWSHLSAFRGDRRRKVRGDTFIY
jgi:hypothetical protein